MKLLIDLYQKYISGLFPPCCRFTPTCSEYAKLAISKHGVLKGTFMAVWRIIRCNPWNENTGVDLP